MTGTATICMVKDTCARRLLLSGKVRQFPQRRNQMANNTFTMRLDGMLLGDRTLVR